MNKKLIDTLYCLMIFLLFISCEKDPKPNTTPPPPAIVSLSFIEEFDTVANLSKKGWVIQNNSEPYGPMAWRQGKYELGGKLGNDVIGFPAYSAVYNQNEFVSVDLNCGADAAILSCWLISPAMPLKNGDMISFYTRSHGDYIDRMQMRANFANAGADVGSGANSVGEFKTLLLDLNENMTDTGYPNVWTKFTITLAGLSAPVPQGRFAFRYYVPNGGPSGANSDMIGIDKLEFISK